jgi:gas vesicle protein
MRKLFFGAILGAVAMYFLDPKQGGERRQLISGLWASRKDTVLEAARTTAGAVSGVSQELGSRVGDALPGGGDSGNGNPVKAEAGTKPEA